MIRFVSSFLCSAVDKVRYYYTRTGNNLREKKWRGDAPEMKEQQISVQLCRLSTSDSLGGVLSFVGA